MEKSKGKGTTVNYDEMNRRNMVEHTRQIKMGKMAAKGSSKELGQNIKKIVENYPAIIVFLNMGGVITLTKLVGSGVKVVMTMKSARGGKTK